MEVIEAIHTRRTWLTSPGVAAEVGIPADYEASAVVLVGYAAEQPTGQPRPRPEVLWC